MASSVIYVSEIVKVLMDDAYLIDERARFIHALGTPPAERKQWEDLHVMGTTTGFEHFSKLLENWVQRTTNSSLGQLKEILESCGCKSAKDSLKYLGNDSTIIKINQQSSASNCTMPKSISFGVMQPTTYFTGRDAEVQQLSELFLNQCPPKIVVISGMGGQGKTELCRQFIKTLKNKNSPPSLTWLGGDNATNLTSSILQFAAALQISTTIESRPIPLTQLLVQVADNISTNSSSSGWLVVIDNVDEDYSEFKQTVHLLVRHGAFVLVTARKIDVLSGGAKQVKLDVMKDEEAYNLVRKCLNHPPITEEDVHHLCRELGSHILALRQAVAYINAQQVENRTSYGIKDYLEEFAKDKTLLNDQDHFVEDYEKTIYIIVIQALNSIHDNHGQLGSRAVQLMDILCLARPDGISVRCLQKFQAILDHQKEGSDSVDLHQALLLLKKYSLITYNDGSVISIHRLVQKVAKCHYGSESSRLILKTIETEICSKYVLQQIMHIWEQADTETIKESPILPCRIFNRMNRLSLVLELKPFAEINHQLLANLLGPDDKNTIFMEHNFAFALSENGDYEGGLTKFKQVYKRKARILGTEHPSTLVTACNLADTLYSLLKFQDSLEWSERLLESQLRVLGTNHPNTMLTRHLMALVLTNLGRIDEAMTLNNQVLDWRMVNLGHSHPGTLCTRHNMAIILWKKGQFKEAKAEFEAVLKLEEQVLGKEHAETLRTKGWLAFMLYKLGRREEALKMNHEVLASQEKVLGPNHPHTIITRQLVSDWEGGTCSQLE